MLKLRIFSGVEAGDLLDIHAALGRADKADAGGLAIHEKRQIKLGLDARPGLDIDAVDLFAHGAGLMRHQRAAEHLLGLIGGFFDRFRQAHTALFARVGLLEGALAAATGMDLRLDHPERPVQLARHGLRLFGARHHAAVGNGRPVLPEKRFCLILVDVHGAVPSVTEMLRMHPSKHSDRLI